MIFIEIEIPATKTDMIISEIEIACFQSCPCQGVNNNESFVAAGRYQPRII